jgi:redox-sensitive bicupin YhaK (pirin superfamily)
VRTFSPTLYADVTMEAVARLPFHADCEERAAYVVEGVVSAGGERCEAGRLVVFRPRADVELVALTPARLLLLGGEPLDGPRHVWWNFVSSSSERIEQAAADWAAGRFAPVPGETERIPLPNAARIARYP